MRCRDCRLSALCFARGGYAKMMFLLCCSEVRPFKAWKLDLDNRLGLVTATIYAGAQLPCEGIPGEKLAMTRAKAFVSQRSWDANVRMMFSPNGEVFR
jgi:hypothetical protein